MTKESKLLAVEIHCPYCDEQITNKSRDVAFELLDDHIRKEHPDKDPGDDDE